MALASPHYEYDPIEHRLPPRRYAWAVFVAFGVMSPGPAQFAFIVLGATIMTGSIGPVCAVVVDVIHPALRATVAATLSLMQNLIGLAGGPLVTGFLSDAYGLPFALSVIPVFSLFAAGLFVMASRTYVADLNAIEGAPAGAGSELTPQAA